MRSRQCNPHVRGTSWEIGIDMCAGAEISCKWEEPKAEELKGLGKEIVTTRKSPKICQAESRRTKRKQRNERASKSGELE